jgi:[CysO sulfur-carrier protein]-S-L-cysteine hydrolase
VTVKVEAVAGSNPELPRRIGIRSDVAAAVVAHCLSGYPEEACGLFAAMGDHGPIDRWYPTRNAAASARRYLVDPTDQLLADRAAEEEEREIVGVFHSHTHTDAYPSPTDVGQAPDPSWFYVVVSLRAELQTLRSYRIAGGSIDEDEVEIVGV